MDKKLGTLSTLWDCGSLLSDQRADFNSKNQLQVAYFDLLDPNQELLFNKYASGSRRGSPVLSKSPKRGICQFSRRNLTKK
jgi:hypothetical protein